MYTDRQFCLPETRAVAAEARKESGINEHQRAELRQSLGRSLETCRAQTIERLIQTVRARSVEPGGHISRQGEAVPITLILEGYGAARRTTSNGKELVNGVFPAGTLFGWSGITSVPSSVGLVALTECRIAQWTGAEIRSLVAQDPGLAMSAIDTMAWSLHAILEGIEGFLHQDARLRVLRILARHRELFFDEPPVLTRAHLPALVGTSREMTGHVLRQLEAEGTVKRVGRAGLKLLRPDQLELTTS